MQRTGANRPIRSIYLHDPQFDRGFRPRAELARWSGVVKTADIKPD
jgi:hypothetical protein